MKKVLSKRNVIPVAVSTAAAFIAAVIILMAINASLLRIPQADHKPEQRVSGAPVSTEVSPGAPDYHVITQRNLFRAKLEAEIPKPKTEKEIEEETLTGIIRTMSLKGVMTGDRQKDYYAVIDRGGQKGVWIYEVGEVVERGLAVKEIRKDAVVLQKGDFGALLRLFAVNAERIPLPSAPTATPATPSKERPDKRKASTTGKGAGGEIRRQGKTLVIPRTVADRLKNDNGTIFSSIALKAVTDASGQPAGYRVMAIDRESIVGKMGLRPDDTLQAVNGRPLGSAEDLKKLYDDLKNASRFELRVLRQGKAETIFYEIR